MTSTTCTVCGLTYVPDYPPDQVLHTAQHNRVIQARNPTANADFLRALSKAQGRPIFVCCASPQWMHDAVHLCSFAFAKEVPGGKTAWPENGSIMPITCHAYLFGDDTKTVRDGAVAGAGGFRQIPRTNGTFRARFEWMWLCPTVRRKGILSRQWPWLKQQNGDFDFDLVTEAMQKFAQKLSTAN